MQLKIDKLTVKGPERSGQLLQLTETMEKKVGGLAQSNILFNDNKEDSKIHEKKVEAKAMKKIGPSKDFKWIIMKRKYTENKKFKYLINEAIIK
uniref:Uncharacterized protein n=1 Tax=Onchocerca volvulus TaxID=6282 RepID=A0A8R1XYK7_ONCVO